MGLRMRCMTVRARQTQKERSTGHKQNFLGLIRCFIVNTLFSYEGNRVVEG